MVTPEVRFYGLRLPVPLAEKIEKLARNEDKLPVEWIREVLREKVG